jgi:peptide/nickel transport system permease protein
LGEYIGKRLLQLIPIILGITFLSFAVIQTAAGDAVDALYDNVPGVVTEEVKAEKRAELGLNKPFLEQYWNWLKGVVSGDMGVSYISKKPVFATFISKLPATIYLTLTSILVTVILSIPLGILAAVKRNSFTDYCIRVLSFAGNSMPSFFISLLLIYVFALKLNIFPVLGNSGGWKSIVLPTLTLSIAMSSKYTRQVRVTVLEELNKDYVVGARARGIRESVIFYASILKTAMLTIITLLALSIGSLLGGTAIVETIFMWDGVGKLAIDSVIMRDYPMIQAYVIWMALIYVLVNLITDILYHYLDPRIRLYRVNLK